MDNPLLASLMRFADAEFDGASVNGPSLMATLRQLPLTEVFSQQTFEGYNVAEIVCHLAYCKHVIAHGALGANTVPAYPYPEGRWGFATLPNPTEAGWAGLLDYLPQIHRLSMQAVLAIGEGKGPAKIEAWDFESFDAAVWLCSHDSYHLAQIRNMGLASLKGKKLA